MFFSLRRQPPAPQTPPEFFSFFLFSDRLSNGHNPGSHTAYPHNRKQSHPIFFFLFFLPPAIAALPCSQQPLPPSHSHTHRPSTLSANNSGASTTGHPNSRPRRRPSRHPIPVIFPSQLLPSPAQPRPCASTIGEPRPSPPRLQRPPLAEEERRAGGVTPPRRRVKPVETDGSGSTFPPLSFLAGGDLQ